MPFETRKPIIGDIFVPMGLFVRMLANGGASDQEIRREYPQVGPRELRALLAYARALPAGLEERFHLLMHDGYWVFGNFTKAKTGKGYWAHYQLRSVREHGGPVAVRRYLARPQAQEGFNTMRELDMMEFSSEALVLQPPQSNLFAPHELETARSWPVAAGYKPEHPREATS